MSNNQLLITMKISVDSVIFTLINKKLNILLLKDQPGPFSDKLVLPGGLIDETIDNDLFAAASRIVEKKAGFTPNHLEQLEAFGSSVRDPRGWTATVAHIALVNNKVNLSPKAIWIDVDKLHDLDLGYDHRLIVDSALKRLKNKVNYSSLPAYFLDQKFTLPQLQEVYEEILGIALDKSSFRKRIVEADFIEPADEISGGAAHRPAQLYVLKQPHIYNFQSNIYRRP